MPSCKAYYKKSVSGPTLDQVPVVCEYPDVFPEELPGMPPDRDIEFVIELILETAPIAQRPYRMSLGSYYYCNDLSLSLLLNGSL
jgi:hypothetical protein